MERIVEVSRGPEGEIVIRLGSPKIKSSETWQHLLGAGRESLLALRSCLDAALHQVEEAEKKAREKRGPTKIEVQ